MPHRHPIGLRRRRDQALPIPAEPEAMAARRLRQNEQVALVPEREFGDLRKWGRRIGIWLTGHARERAQA